MRTLTFGDRTISYDAGLDTINTEQATTGSKGFFKKSLQITRAHHFSLRVCVA